MHRDQKWSIITKSKEVLLNNRYKKLGGIFDITFEYSRGIFECDMNEKSCQGLKHFVEKEGPRKSIIDTFGSNEF
jgi:hypothetical protein